MKQAQEMDNEPKKMIRTKHAVTAFDPMPTLTTGYFEVEIETDTEYLVKLPSGNMTWFHKGDCEVVKCPDDSGS